MSDDKIENLTEWHRWFEKYVSPVFSTENKDEYFERLKRIQAPFYPKFWVAQKFYEKIRNDNRFDDELKQFFSFLYSCGFFMEFVIDFNEWLQIRNWENPSLQELDIKKESIIELLDKPGGISILKQKLRWLPFLNRPEGN